MAAEKGLIVACALGDCVHVAGVMNFLHLAEQQGWETAFLGPATSVAELVGAIQEAEPELVAVSYRLSPEAARRLFDQLAAAVQQAGAGERRFILGGTPPVCAVGEETGFFERSFSSHSTEAEIIAFLRGEEIGPGASDYPQDLVTRIRSQAPYPVLRHHFGLPDLLKTIAGISRLAMAQVLDVISLGPDQNAQAHFFHPERMDPAQDGAGGVPIRTEADLATLYQASRCGNYPLMRCYSGTADVIRFAELLLRTINNAWCAVPLCWYNVLDGRGTRPVRVSIAQAQELMAWHAERAVPVEVNEAHHWSLRAAPDTVAVAAAYLAAYNARAAGVKNYVAQYMFNTPPGTSGVMDLAKMLAKAELIESLHNKEFTSWRQVRTGLASLAADLNVAKGELAASTYLQMALRPHIIHVVSFSEADHAATAEDVIEACQITRGVIGHCLSGMPNMAEDVRVQERKEELLAEVNLTLAAIRNVAPAAVKDPFTDGETLARAIETGVLDAPHLAGNEAGFGRSMTKVVDGACRAVDSAGRVLSEAERLAALAALD
ncbi:MAG: methionine synthase [Bacillota bacterium]